MSPDPVSTLHIHVIHLVVSLLHVFHNHWCCTFLASLTCDPGGVYFLVFLYSGLVNPTLRLLLAAGVLLWLFAAAPDCT